MRGWRVIVVMVALWGIVGCSSARRVELQGVTLSQVTYPTESSEESLPQYITLAAEVVNDGGAIKINRCRFDLYYKWRKVAIVTLEKAVKIPGHKSSTVMLPMHIAVAHNSSTLPMRNALKRGEWDDVQIGWNAKVRRSIATLKIEQAAGAIDAVLSPETLEQIRNIFEEE